MAENQNGIDNDNDNDEQRKLSVTEQKEVDDKFPQQIASKNANWNTMELGEKRKRLR